MVEHYEIVATLVFVERLAKNRNAAVRDPDILREIRIEAKGVSEPRLPQETRQFSPPAADV
jgi:hypothetical protein